MKCPYCNEELTYINTLAAGVIVNDIYDINNDGSIDIMNCIRSEENWDFVDRIIVQCPECLAELPEEFYKNIKGIEHILV